MINKSPQKRSKGRPKSFDKEVALCAALKLFWEKGFEPTSVAELCEAMEINPPSLYCCFGNKAGLFMEAVQYYEKKYWEKPAEILISEPDIYKAIDEYFMSAAKILLSPNSPCGCMVVLAAVNISPQETDIIKLIRDMRMETKNMFSSRLAQAIADGQIPPETDVPTIAGSLTTFLEGLSLQAKDGIFLSQLLSLASCASRMLPQR